ncbi:hypothetical protein SG34_026480 [Thalassomonas viridans]|uniref:Uncharacterized protein n=1 Tax=Thalassomonas viridans TaxID=137584 RepID=A0AAE9Z469_9GAMM|nr:hypothetical protein [Thalassomonas viridans]WDE04817.1 hypothetical protein SG34_026480 [Thalassomonas viridans]
MFTNFLYQILLPLAYLGQYPGVTLAIAGVILFFTLISKFSKQQAQIKIKLWSCVIAALLYGLYDIYFYLYSDANIRFDLMFLGPIYYFSLFYWLIIYRQEYKSPSAV